MDFCDDVQISIKFSLLCFFTRVNSLKREEKRWKFRKMIYQRRIFSKRLIAEKRLLRTEEKNCKGKVK